MSAEHNLFVPVVEPNPEFRRSILDILGAYEIDAEGFDPYLLSPLLLERWRSSKGADVTALVIGLGPRYELSFDLLKEIHLSTQESMPKGKGLILLTNPDKEAQLPESLRNLIPDVTIFKKPYDPNSLVTEIMALQKMRAA